MSRTRHTEFEDLCLAIPCATCGQQPRQWCVTRSLAWASWVHSSREFPIMQAMNLGRREERALVARRGRIGHRSEGESDAMQ